MIRRRRGGPAGASKGAPRTAILLGPQTPTPTLGAVVRELEEVGRLAAGSPIAVVSAGWQEREGEPHILDPRVADRAVELGLYRRAEELAASDPELVRAHKELQGRLKSLRAAYNARLDPSIAVQVALAELEGDPVVLKEEREAALEALRELDRRHLERVVEIRRAYERRHRPAERPAVERHREELRALLEPAGILAIAGGHVASLLNRLRLFGVGDLIGERVVIAWSAGAMAVSSVVVLFHDRPPWGAGNAEAFDRGLGLVSGIVPFPHASARLALEDRTRAARLARRFAPDACLLLDAGVRVDCEEGVWTSKTALRLDRAGRPTRFRTRAA